MDLAAVALDEPRRQRLVEERTALRRRLAEFEARGTRASIEQAFILVARSYGWVEGISYATWREVGVPAAVLQRAGIGPLAGCWR